MLFLTEYELVRPRLVMIWFNQSVRRLKMMLISCCGILILCSDFCSSSKLTESYALLMSCDRSQSWLELVKIFLIQSVFIFYMKFVDKKNDKLRAMLW